MGFDSSKSMLVNMESIPEWNSKRHFFEQSRDTLQFFEEEFYKLRNGVNIGGYFVSPLLYSLLNVFKAPIPVSKGEDKLMHPPLTDNILYCTESYYEAEEANKMLLLFGTRGFSKSTLISGITQHTILTKANGNFTITGGDEEDLQSIGSLMKKTFENANPAFFIPTLKKDWEDYVEFGFQDKHSSGRRYTHSEILVKNAVKGQDSASEKGAGLSPIGAVYDEIGKYAFKKNLEGALAGYRNAFGFKLVPVLSGTSGNVSLAKDAKEVLENPEAFDILPANFDRLSRFVRDVDMETWFDDKKRAFGTFVPGQMSHRLNTPKVSESFGDFVGSSSPELKNMAINMTDWKAAEKEIQTLIDKKNRESGKNKETMYFPRKLDDCFLTQSPNPFPTDIIIKMLREKKSSGDVGRSVTLYKDNSQVKAQFSDKKRAEVSHPGGSVDAPIVLFGALPETKPEKFENVSGLDDYKQNVANTDSLGAWYAIKRRNLSPNSPCETIVASYASRPERHGTFHKTLEIGIEAFNAECLMEAADTGFIDYLEEKNKAHEFLAPEITFAKKGKTGKTFGYGLYPTEGNNEYRMNLFIDWCWEEHVIGIDEEGKKVVKYGVEFIDCLDLLQEMLDWSKNGNFDRIAAFSHALVRANELDKANVRPKSNRPAKKDVAQKKKTVSKQSPYSTKHRSPYGRRR